MAKNSLLVVLLLVAGMAEAYPIKPNPEFTQGDLCNEQNHDYMGRKYPEQIPVCRRDVDWDLKRRIYDEYKIPVDCRRRYTIDHFIPLSIGGTNSAKNLWPEHRLVKEKRFDLEQEIFDKVAAGTMKQEEAIARIREAKLNPDPSLFELLENCDKADN